MGITRITTDGLTDDLVTQPKIAVGAITTTELAGDIPANKLEVNDAHIIIGDGSNDGSLQTLSGDVSMSRTGVVTISNDAITADKIADNAVTTALIADGTITNANISSSANIDASKIANLNTDLVNDTSPQLGGDLQSNGNDIDIADNDKAVFGTGSDLKLYYDGSDGILESTVSTELFIYKNTAGNSEFRIQGHEGSAASLSLYADEGDDPQDRWKFTAFTDGVLDLLYFKGSTSTFATTARFTNDGGTELRHTNVKVFETLGTGAKVTGALTVTSDLDLKGAAGATKLFFDSSQDQLEFADSCTVTFGDHSTTGDYSVSYVNGGDFAILAMAGGSQDLVVGRYENAATKKHLVSTRAGVIELYHDDSKKLETTSSGVTVTGGVTASSTVHCNGGLDTDGDVQFNSGTTNMNILFDASEQSLEFDDNVKASFGSSADFKIFHDATDNIIQAYGSPKIRLRHSTSAGNNVKNAIVTIADGAVELYHNNSKTFETTSSGISVTGAVYSSTGVVGEDSANHFDFVTDNRIAVSINSSEDFRFTTGGTFHANGDVIAFSTTISSDENLKKNITTITDSVTKVEALKGVTFAWKKNDAVSAGVIAQDVQKVLPEAVKTVSDFDGNDYLAVNYGALTSILIEAIKDLSARIKVLEAK